MLKEISIRKIMIASFTLIILLLLYIIPSDLNKATLQDSKLEYVSLDNLEVIYLLDSNNYLARTTLAVEEEEVEDKASSLLEGLIIDGKKSEIIPNGFRSIIPSGTTILDLSLNNSLLIINFSKDILDIKEEYEEKMFEAITYTLTSIKGIDKVEIQVEGEKLERLPNSKKVLPTYLDKSYGINKVYELNTYQDIDKYTIYYVNTYHNNNYYVPVTKYVNNKDQDKIKVIIEQLSSAPIYESNLISYLNVNTKLLNYEISEKEVKLYFNDFIYNDLNNDNILEEVVYTISLSILDIYEVEKVIFYVNDEAVYTFFEKGLEK